MRQINFLKRKAMLLVFPLLTVLLMTHCGQFSSFSESETAQFLSQNPVFAQPAGTSVGQDPNDEGGQNPEYRNTRSPNPRGSITGPPDTVGNTNTDRTITMPPLRSHPTGGNTNTNPVCRWCGPNQDRFQVLLPGDQYSQCRPCVTQGTRIIDGKETLICEVQRCEGSNQYIFFGNDPQNPSVTCTRCDRLNSDRTACETVVVIEQTPPASTPTCTTGQVSRNGICVTSTPTSTSKTNCPSGRMVKGVCVTSTSKKKTCTGGKVLINEKCVVPPSSTPEVIEETGISSGGGDDGGGGNGDDCPLMIDSQGVEYANADVLRNSDTSYFNSGELSLTSPGKGVKFNLLGQQHTTQLESGQFLHIKPQAHHFKFQISWTKPHQSRYRWLVLPDARGQINGIDELFGNNTFGPDARSPFAKDGFRALMKWDRGDAGNKDNRVSDGYIDSGDSVFTKLRLWHDLNSDGNCDSPEEIKRELVSLEEAGITYIHLVANENFHETDIHGNHITYKSLVGFRSSEGRGHRLGTMFDIWFRYDASEILRTGYAEIKNKR